MFLAFYFAAPHIKYVSVNYLTYLLPYYLSMKKKLKFGSGYFMLMFSYALQLPFL